MQYKLLILILTFLCTSIARAEEDPYLWLEAVDDDKALAWVRAENDLTAKRLQSSPLLEDLYTEAKAILNSSSRLPSVYQEENWLYNLWRDKTNPRGIFRRTSLAEFATDNPAWEVVINIDALSKQEDKQWVFKGMNCLPRQPEHCLVRLSLGGGGGGGDAEAYVLEPLAQQMLASDGALQARFDKKIASDAEFAARPKQRIMWFYQQTPFYDQQYLLYPIARVPVSKPIGDIE